MNKPQDSRFSPKTYFLFIALLAFGGLAASIYLSFSHYRNFTDIGYQSFCAISRSLNCDTVSQSPYAIFLNVPVAVWGSLGYLFFLIFLIVFNRHEKNGWAFICTVAALFSLTSIALALVSSFLIHSYCLMCIVTYAINFLLLLLSWMAQQRFGPGSFFSDIKRDVLFFHEKRVHAFIIAGIFIVLSLSAIRFYPKYWRYPAFPENPTIEHGVTEDGTPWIGARHPALTITEYADYLCFQCGKMHSYLRRMVGAYPGRIRLVHRQFPLDRVVNPLLKETVHPKSGLLALFAVYAQEKGKFWQVNDLLFRDAREKKKINLGSIDRSVGLDLSDIRTVLTDKRAIDRLKADIRAGMQLGVSATPSFEIKGKLYTGTIPEDVLLPVIKGR